MDTLVKTALVGVAKRADMQFDVEHDVVKILKPFSMNDSEDRLLITAGAYSLFEQAGQLANHEIPSLPVAPVSDNSLRSRELINMLYLVLNTPKHELLPDFLIALKQSGLDLPHEVLPQALNITDPGLRQQLLSVLGERGRWLSQWNPRWEWVAQGIAAISEQDRSALRRAWDDGKLAQRALALAVIRRTDSAEGRRWIDETLPTEKADARVEFVRQLQNGLCADDEILLERLLEDRSEQVKQLAVSLLQLLPSSALVGRMQVRGQAMLQLAKSKLSVHLPDELPKDWIRDGISTKAPAGRGKRAFWLEQVLSSVPLTYWTSHFSTEPSSLVAAVRDDDYAEDVILGWTRSIEHFNEDNSARLAWAHALWNHWLLRWQQDKKKGHLILSKMVVLIKLFPSATAEQHVLPFLVPGQFDINGLTLLLEILPQPWSQAFAEQYLKLARQVVTSGLIDQAYEWGKTLGMAARAVPRSVFIAALIPWNLERAGEKSWTAKALAQEVERFCEVVRFRQLFLDELSLQQKKNR